LLFSFLKIPNHLAHHYRHPIYYNFYPANSSSFYFFTFTLYIQSFRSLYSPHPYRHVSTSTLHISIVLSLISNSAFNSPFPFPMTLYLLANNLPSPLPHNPYSPSLHTQLCFSSLLYNLSTSHAFSYLLTSSINRNVLTPCFLSFIIYTLPVTLPPHCVYQLHLFTPMFITSSSCPQTFHHFSQFHNYFLSFPGTSLFNNLITILIIILFRLLFANRDSSPSYSLCRMDKRAHTHTHTHTHTLPM